MMQLLAVACLYLAAKMEETKVPLAVDLQTESRFVFEAKTIQRIELLVLSTLKWRMQSVTLFSTYVRSPFAEDYSLSIGYYISIFFVFEVIIHSVYSVFVRCGNFVGYPTFKGQVLNGKELWNLVEGLEANNLLYYTHLLTGYIGSESFLNTVLEVVKKLRSVNPGLLYVCDPVLGDEGKLYVPQELVSVYREKVVPVSSMLTPNQFEAELLTGSRIVSEQDGLEACNILHAAGPAKVVITSININGNLLLIGSHQKGKDKPPEQFKIRLPKIPAYFTGTGDLTTALLLGWSNKYLDNLEKAAELTVSSLQALLQKTVDDYRQAGFDPCTSSLEIRLIQSQDVIKNPEVKFKAERY